MKSWSGRSKHQRNITLAARRTHLPPQILQVSISSETHRLSVGQLGPSGSLTAARECFSQSRWSFCWTPQFCVWPCSRDNKGAYQRLGITWSSLRSIWLIVEGLGDTFVSGWGSGKPWQLGQQRQLSVSYRPGRSRRSKIQDLLFPGAFLGVFESVLGFPHNAPGEVNPAVLVHEVAFLYPVVHRPHNAHHAVLHDCCHWQPLHDHDDVLVKKQINNWHSPKSLVASWHCPFLVGPGTSCLILNQVKFFQTKWISN